MLSTNILAQYGKIGLRKDSMDCPQQETSKGSPLHMSSSSSFDHLSGRDIDGVFVLNTTVRYRCTQALGVKSWNPSNHFQVC